MTDVIVEFFREYINNDNWTIIIIAILPIIELRGAIPVAIGMEFNPFMALFLAYIGSIIVVPFLLLLLRPILNLMKRIKFINRIAIAIEDGFQEKADKVIKKAHEKDKVIEGKIELKYKLWAVLIFVAFPIPMTGVWTGSAVAAFLDIKFFPALLVILAGNLCAGIIMTLLSVFFINYLDIIITSFLTLVIIVLIIYVITIIVRSRKAPDKKTS